MQVDDKIPVQVHHNEAQDDQQLLQPISTNPKERAINSLVTMHQEEPSAGSDLIAKLNPCDISNLWETSVHLGFQKQFAMVDINKFSKF